MSKTKTIRMNIVLEIKASEYFAQELQKELNDKILGNCFKSNDRTLIDAKIERIQ